MGPGKGNTNNPNGRPKGRPNKVTQEARETLNLIIEGQIDKINESLEKVRKEDHYKYLYVLERYMSYIIPKKRDITSDGAKISPDEIVIKVTTDEQRKRLSSGD